MDWYDTHHYGAQPGQAGSGGPVPRWGVNREFDEYYRSKFGLSAVAESEEEAELRRAAWATWKTPGPTFRPPTRPSAVADEDDDELNRALALSMEDHVGRGSGSGTDNAVVVSDDEDDEVMRRVLEQSYNEHHDPPFGERRHLEQPQITQRIVSADGNAGDWEDIRFDPYISTAMQARESEARAAKRPRREETPDEERKMLEEAIKASMKSADTAQPPSQASTAVEREDSPEVALRAANEAFQAERQADRERQRRERETKRQAQAAEALEPLRSGTSIPVPGAASTGSNARGDRQPDSGPAAIPSDSTPLLSRPNVNKGLLLDRAQMERERLARQAARQSQAGNASPSSSSDLPTTKPLPSSTSTDSRASAAKATSASTSRQAGLSRLTGPMSPSTHPLQSTGPFPSDAAGEYYLDGEMRHSKLTIGEPTAVPTFTIEQMIGKRSEISLLIMSSFVLDDEWLQGKLPDPDVTPTIVIRPAPREKHFEWNGKTQVQPSGEVFCFPTMIGEYGSAHMKFCWIFYKTGRLRVVVMSANLVPYDWDWIENSIFIQDFLPTKTSSPLDPGLPGHGFPLEFKRLFLHLKLQKALRFLREHHSQRGDIPFSHEDGFAAMAKWDWSRVKVKLVMSVPGTYEGSDQMELYGICRLGKVLREQGWTPGSGDKLVAEYQGSSLGTYSFSWFDAFYQLCSGRTVEWLKNAAKAKTWPPLKVLFPSLATVDQSVLGRDGGGTMFCGKAFTAVTKPLFHDSNSKRGGVLMHAKVLIGLFEPQDRALGFTPSSPVKPQKRKADEVDGDGETSGNGIGGWVYMGSHNFSPAAWGTVNLKKHTLNVRNYEMGIVFPLPKQNARATADVVAPYKRPARPYSAGDIPWNQYDHNKPSNT